MNSYIVKNHSHNSEQFDPVKLHSSILAACMTVRAFEGEAHATAERVCKEVIDWIEEKTEVTSADIRRIAGQKLSIYHPDAAYMYEQHNIMI